MVVIFSHMLIMEVGGGVLEYVPIEIASDKGPDLKY